MQKRQLSLLERTIANLIIFMFAVGMVWLVAWWAKPDIDSGTVWLLAFIFASLDAQITRVVTKVGA